MNDSFVPAERGSPLWHARMTAHTDNLAAMVAEYGFAVQPVFSTTDDSPSFAYTIGLWPAHSGEFIIRGFGGHTKDMIAVIAQEVLDGKILLAVGVHELSSKQRIRVDSWRGDPADFGMANRYHGRDDYPKLHVIVADDDGRLPGDPGCTVEKYQMLGLPPQIAGV